MRSAWAGAAVGWALGFLLSTLASYRRDDTVDTMATKGLATAAMLALAGAAAGLIFDRRLERRQ
ncbi:MAG: hypothetical protein J2O39_07185 [Acidimicrobiales bacterium]|nr:hypothetical protein [Acidimicrobiales bacterium]MBO0886306.1 hypothetical protein [Acidimicrobiales bacterium]MBO0894145.1 hypothetical protein [Acidimicrobiales bacterium]